MKCNAILKKIDSLYPLISQNSRIYKEKQKELKKQEQEKPKVQESTIKIEGSTNYDNLWNVQGYYNDNDGFDIRDRD